MDGLFPRCVETLPNEIPDARPLAYAFLDMLHGTLVDRLALTEDEKRLRAGTIAGPATRRVPDHDARATGIAEDRLPLFRVPIAGMVERGGKTARIRCTLVVDRELKIVRVLTESTDPAADDPEFFRARWKRLGADGRVLNE